jgi:hypothetical protein
MTELIEVNLGYSSDIHICCHGSYIITVTDVNDFGATACFVLSHSQSESSVIKLSSCKGIEGEEIHIVWESMLPQLSFIGGSGTKKYTVSTLS